MLSITIFITGFSNKAWSQQTPLSETAYLQQLYSIMTELSQVGHEVSVNAVKLQPAPEEICENEFGREHTCELHPNLDRQRRSL